MLEDEVQAVYVMLGTQAGIDPIADSNLRGRIQATLSIIGIQFDDVYGGTND